MIHPTAVIDEGAIIGEGTKIWHFTHVMPGARIGRNCVIGQNCYIDGVIGDGCKIQNNVSIYPGVTLERNVFVGPSAVFTNDLWPRAYGDWKVTPTLVHEGASIGANATILCGIQIGRHAMVACGSVVNRNVEHYSCVCGVPACHFRWVKEMPLEDIQGQCDKRRATCPPR